MPRIPSNIFPFFAALIASGLSLNPAAAVEIRDPAGILDRLDAERATQPFEDLFRSDDSASVKIMNEACKFACQDGFCFSMCNEVTELRDRKVDAITPTGVSFYWSNGATEEYDRSEFNANRNSFFRMGLKRLDTFLGMSGEVNLVDLKEIDYALTDGRKIPAWEVNVDFITKDQSILPCVYRISKAGPAIGEILYFEASGTKISILKSLSRLGTSLR